jgi:hypothetical protein
MRCLSPSLEPIHRCSTGHLSQRQAPAFPEARTTSSTSRNASAGVSLLLAVALSAFAPDALQAQSDDTGFVSMFNGRTLTGWTGEAGFWKVEDGAIVGETKAANQHTTFLYGDGGEPADFELRYRIRVLGKDANSGVQIRSEKRPNWDALGYQADFDVSGYLVGSLYRYQRQPLATFAQRGDSVRIDATGNRTVVNFADPATLLGVHRQGDWNDFRLVAKGHRVTVWLNGVMMCTVEDYQQPYALPRGIIALQLHSGEPMRVELKDVRIRID